LMAPVEDADAVSDLIRTSQDEGLHAIDPSRPILPLRRSVIVNYRAIERFASPRRPPRPHRSKSVFRPDPRRLARSRGAAGSPRVV
jgi:hypothetical protein